MDKTYRNCIVADFVIISVILLLVWVFRIEVINYLVLAGFILLIGLPWYIAARWKNKQGEYHKAREIEQSLDACKEYLEEVEECINNCKKRFMKIKSYDEFKSEMLRKRRTFKNFEEQCKAEFEEKWTAKEELTAIEGCVP